MKRLVPFMIILATPSACMESTPGLSGGSQSAARPKPAAEAVESGSTAKPAKPAKPQSNEPTQKPTPKPGQEPGVKPGPNAGPTPKPGPGPTPKPGPGPAPSSAAVPSFAGTWSDSCEFSGSDGPDDVITADRSKVVFKETSSGVGTLEVTINLYVDKTCSDVTQTITSFGTFAVSPPTSDGSYPTKISIGRQSYQASPGFLTENQRPGTICNVPMTPEEVASFNADRFCGRQDWQAEENCFRPMDCDDTQTFTGTFNFASGVLSFVSNARIYRGFPSRPLTRQ